MRPTAHGTWHWLSLMCFAALTLCVSAVQAQNGDQGSMVGIIFKCAKQIDWPNDKMRPGAPFVIGVMGSESMAAAIQELNAGRKLKEREVVVKHFAATQEIGGCHILFIGRSEAPRQRAIANEARRNNVLTFGETDNFEKDGGMITFFVDGVMKFSVNYRNVRHTNLKVSSDLFGSAPKINDRDR